MPFCPNCGAEIEGGISFCPYCGGQVSQAKESQQTQVPQPPAAPQPPVQQTYQQPVVQQQTYSQPYQQPTYQNQVAPVATGGLMAWSIITLLLCTIPGIVALVQTVGINKCTTPEEQQKKMSSARTWCIVGTVLGILAIIGSVAQAMAQ